MGACNSHKDNKSTKPIVNHTLTTTPTLMYSETMLQGPRVIRNQISNKTEYDGKKSLTFKTSISSTPLGITLVMEATV
jgi:hypothetical protein